MEACTIEDDYLAKSFRNNEFSTIEDFSLRSKSLAKLPENFGLCFVNLIRLDLSQNNFKYLPHSLKFIDRLKELVLDSNGIYYLPPTITEVTNLTTLKLSKNFLSSLPDNIRRLRCLETLDLSFNRLTELPESCKDLNKLRVLDLTGNFLKLTPRCITLGMINLETLHLSRNPCINLSPRPASRKLKELYARESQQNSKFPIWVLSGNAPNLQILDLDGTAFESFDFPEKPLDLPTKDLSFRRCGIRDTFLQKMTSFTGELVSLKAGNDKSCFGGNAFRRMPIENLKSPEKVENMDFRSTGLNNVCASIEKFVNLVELDIGRNTLHRLPGEICCLKKLEILIVDGNLLSSLPEDIGCMTSLRELRAERNALDTLPRSLRELKSLAYLDLYENDFRDIPEEIKSMEYLIGLDIDGNPVDAKDLRIRKIKYKVLRANLRDRYKNMECARETGPKFETDSERSDAGSDHEWKNCEEWNANQSEKVTEPIHENWDISEDSAEEYDPNCDDGKSTRKPWVQFSYTAAVTRGLLFCPASSHPIPMKQRIAELKKKGLYQRFSDTEVEGQFEDA